ncbi:MAG: hypothetical protein IAC78_04135 [Firmicutes bacterium]|uniref:Chloramphenicol acetyltransferase n=1 Tax=Candidatus Scatoplasma merdavium TaxID=2840932 RepID=A0A9D9GSB0_9BACL|nr:hypothetical protein [Candidatus Scatoplasma merdavium]
MKKLDLKHYIKRNQYNYFKTYLNPTYGFNVDIDVTKLIELNKEKNVSFFIVFMYYLMLGLNSVYELRLREIKNEVYECETVNPTFTVLNNSGVYLNSGFEMDFDFDAFTKKCREIIEITKTLDIDDNLDRFPICNDPSAVYATTIPTLNYTSMSHPIPLGNYDSMSVTRACFGKYFFKENKCYVNLNLTVSHTLVDGLPLAQAFNNIQTLVLLPPKEAYEKYLELRKKYQK